MSTRRRIPYFCLGGSDLAWGRFGRRRSVRAHARVVGCSVGERCMTTLVSLGNRLVKELRAGSVHRDAVDAMLGQLADQARAAIQDETDETGPAGGSVEIGLILEILNTSPLLRSGIRTLLFNDHDVEDAVQETLLAVSKSIIYYEGRSSVLAWATGIARNKAKDILRRQGRPASPDPVVSFAPSGSRFTSNWVTRADMDLALSGLSSKLRDVFELVDIEGRSYDDVAVLLDLPRNTVGSRVRRARAQLAEQMVVDLPASLDGEPV